MRLRDFNGLDRIILWYFCCVQLFSFPAALFRIDGVPYFRGPYFDQIFLLFIFLSIVFSIFAFKKPLIEKSLLSLVLFFLVYILVIGFIRNNEAPLNGLRYFILPVLVYLVLLGRKFVIFFYTSKVFWTLVLVSHILGLLYYFSTLFGIYPGIGTPSIAFAAIFFFCNGNPALLAISIVCVLLEGKRSIQLVLLLTFLFIRVVRYRAEAQVYYIAVATSTAVLIIFGILIFLADIEGIGAINRINYINPFSEGYDIYMGSSGRFGELVSYFGRDSIEQILIGAGSGFEYVWNFGYLHVLDGQLVKGYLHMSAANYLAVGGGVGLIVFFLIATLPFRATKLRTAVAFKENAFGFGVFAILYSFFGFNLATDPFFWLFILGPSVLLSFEAKTENFGRMPSHRGRSNQGRVS